MANYTRPDATFPAIAENGVRTAMSPADVGAGWSTTSQTRPPAADFNARDFYSSAGLKYLLRLGVAEYSPTESYQGLGLCAGSNGSVYWNLIACTGVDPVTDTTGKWEKTAIRRADCAELIGNVTGGVIPETFNLLKGNNLGSAADSGILSDGTTTTFPMNVVMQKSLIAGNLWIGNTTQPAGQPSIRTTVAGHVVINPSGGNPLLLNWESGGSGVTFGNGATTAVASVDNAGQMITPCLIATGMVQTFNNGTAFVDAYQAGGRLFAKSSGPQLASIMLAGYSDNGDARYANYLICSEPSRGVPQVAATVPIFTCANAHLRIIDRVASGITLGGPMPSITADPTNLILNGGQNGNVYFNWDSGTGGVYFGNGSSGQVGRLDGAGSLSISGTFGCHNSVAISPNANMTMLNLYSGLPGGGNFLGWAQDGDAIIMFQKGANATGGLVIGGWGSNTGIRIDGLNANVSIYGNLGLANNLSVAGFTFHTPGGSSFIDCATPFFYVQFTGSPSGTMQLLNGSFIAVNGNFTGNLAAAGLANFATLQIAGAAPAGQVLTGNGSTYVPMPPNAPSGVPSDVTGQRILQGTYQNNTGRAIFVAVSATVGSGGGLLRAYIGGGSPSMLVGGQDRVNSGGNNNLGGGANYAMMVSFIVPAGWFYQVQEAAGNTGNPALMSWIEYQL